MKIEINVLDKGYEVVWEDIGKKYASNFDSILHRLAYVLIKPRQHHNIDISVQVDDRTQKEELI